MFKRFAALFKPQPKTPEEELKEMTEIEINQVISSCNHLLSRTTDRDEILHYQKQRTQCLKELRGRDERITRPSLQPPCEPF